MSPSSWCSARRGVSGAVGSQRGFRLKRTSLLISSTIPRAPLFRGQATKSRNSRAVREHGCVPGQAMGCVRFRPECPAFAGRTPQAAESMNSSSATASMWQVRGNRSTRVSRSRLKPPPISAARNRRAPAWPDRRKRSPGFAAGARANARRCDGRGRPAEGPPGPCRDSRWPGPGTLGAAMNLHAVRGVELQVPHRAVFGFDRAHLAKAPRQGQRKQATPAYRSSAARPRRRPPPSSQPFHQKAVHLERNAGRLGSARPPPCTRWAPCLRPGIPSAHQSKKGSATPRSERANVEMDAVSFVNNSM